MDASSLRDNIKLLIHQLEKEVHNLSDGQQTDIVRITGAILHDLEQLQNDFDRQLTSADTRDKHRIVELEEEIRYLKELI